jgi:MFS transporter, FHS family, L-fucose permease
MLTLYGIACSAFSCATAFAPGKAGIGALFALFFFESICYPVVFTLATKNLGRHTKRGAGLITMSIGGGAWYPPAQASIADHNTRRSFLVPFAGFVTMTIYAVSVLLVILQTLSFDIFSGIVIEQAVSGGFRWRTVSELEHQLEEAKDHTQSPASEDPEKKVSEMLERVENTEENVINLPDTIAHV